MLQGAFACGLVVAGVCVATAAYRTSGLSRLYFWAEYSESALTAAGYSYLIYASGTPQSFFWFLYFAHTLVLGASGTSLRNSLLLGGAPAADVVLAGAALAAMAADAPLVLRWNASPTGTNSLTSIVDGPRGPSWFETCLKRQTALAGSVWRLWGIE